MQSPTTPSTANASVVAANERPKEWPRYKPLLGSTRRQTSANNLNCGTFEISIARDSGFVITPDMAIGASAAAAAPAADHFSPNAQGNDTSASAAMGTWMITVSAMSFMALVLSSGRTECGVRRAASTNLP